MDKLRFTLPKLDCLSDFFEFAFKRKNNSAREDDISSFPQDIFLIILKITTIFVYIFIFRTHLFSNRVISEEKEN
ncbi:hypothetical protein BpHYR1_026504 [Brachionus plicatilis]|uniref:Uncharacterized protein n=1 Tax=Brachionus plicatilis TaxID=10195 RepID=A0A3M7P9Y3_BRAPC|nr:hypothetical protein BpHYR1_026504 [Brachionus plicatilis]